jgi:membrane-associated phospholipid phosphatase
MAVTEGLKALVKEKRPDSNEHDSFPSGHATAAFAVATAQSALHPRQAIFWYAGATVISWSRLRLNRHHPQDVIAGAAIGFGMTRWEMSEHHGLILQPWIHDDKPGMIIERSF